MNVTLDTDLTGHHCPDPLRHAFAAKKSAHAGRGKAKPLPPESVHRTWAQITAQPAQPQVRMAYFHIPFCRTHCSYCGFFQNTTRADEVEKFVSYLEREIELTANNTYVQSQPFHAVYFGGGTPK